MHLLSAYTVITYCPVIFAGDVALNQAIGGLLDLLRTVLHSCDGA